MPGELKLHIMTSQLKKKVAQQDHLLPTRAQLGRAPTRVEGAPGSHARLGLRLNPKKERSKSQTKGGLGQAHLAQQSVRFTSVQNGFNCCASAIVISVHSLQCLAW